MELFQSTHPVWGATPSPAPSPRSVTISIHAPRVGCDSSTLTFNVHQTISIHAPRVGCDITNAIDVLKNKEISIHAPRVGCDHGYLSILDGQRGFQSTHPVWGATC